MGVRQFLLNVDGSVPEGTDVETLKRHGIPLVLPTAPPLVPPGFELREREPELVDGVWRQVWTVEASPVVAADELAELAEQG